MIDGTFTALRVNIGHYYRRPFPYGTRGPGFVMMNRSPSSVLPSGEKYTI